jgi:hypothetical protein
VSKRARAVFLERLAAGFSVTHAADGAGVYRRRFYELREVDEEFARAWADAYESGTDALRDEARRRAVEGVSEPLVSAGKIVGHKVVYSDRLLELELKRRDPAYRERAGGVNVAVGVGDFRPKPQQGVSLAGVAKVLLDAGVDLAGLAAAHELEAPADAAEVVAVEDEPAEGDA